MDEGVDDNDAVLILDRVEAGGVEVSEHGGVPRLIRDFSRDIAGHFARRDDGAPRERGEGGENVMDVGVLPGDRDAWLLRALLHRHEFREADLWLAARLTDL